MKIFLKYFLVPILLCLVAGIQFFQSQTSYLSPWKGGGFGMYTTIHPLYSKITINDSIVADTIFKKGYYNSYNTSKKQFLLYPNQVRLNEFISKTKYYNRDSLKINIYSPNVSIDNHTINYQKSSYEGYYSKN